MTRIVVPRVDADRLRISAEVFADDLLRATGIRLPIVARPQATPRAGDITFVLQPATPDLGQEGYEIKVGTWIELRGTERGVFLGTRTLLQWFRQVRRIPAGIARDWPRYRERGLLVANGAKHFTIPWWEGQIRELSYLKMNMLWIYVGYDTTPFDEMKAIAAFAARYNIIVVPQLNMPDHMDPLLRDRPDLQLPGRPQSLDLSNPDAYPFARGLTEPLLDKFDTPFWHMGSDEYLLGSSYDDYPQLEAYAKEHYGPQAVPQDIHYGFVNFINETVRAHDKTMRMWNDGIYTGATVPIDKDVIIEHWAQWPDRKSPQQLIDEGYRISNSNPDFLYYDPGLRHPDPAGIYERFQAGIFSSGQIVSDDDPALLGAKLHLWTLPDVEVEEEESNNLAAPLRSLAQVLWGSPKPSPAYAGFASLISLLGRAPGFPTLRFRTSPVDGATSVPPTRPISVRFFDDVQPNSIKLTLRAPGGREVSGTTTIDTATQIAVFTPSAPLAWMSKHTATLKAATDTAGNTLGAPRSWTFRTAEQPHDGPPYTIWQDAEGPLNFGVTGTELELGVKFRSDVDGIAIGLRFYKGENGGGLHVGSLWSADGTKLASATFTAESATGWQEVRFNEAVALSANTTYVASYHVEAWTSYAGTNDVFTSSGKDSPPLHALQDGADGGNGVFRYGPSGFPSDSFRASNYWVDVVFDGR